MEPLLLLLIIFLLNLIQQCLKILHLDFHYIYLFINMLLIIKIQEHLNNQVNLLVLLDQTNLFNFILHFYFIIIIIHLILIFLMNQHCLYYFQIYYLYYCLIYQFSFLMQYYYYFNFYQNLECVAIQVFLYQLF